MPGQDRPLDLDNAGRSASWARFLREAHAPILQIGTHRGERCRPDAVTADLYDPEADEQWDVMDLDPMVCGTFGAVCCHAVLEHVPRPTDALLALRGVVERQGLLHIEVPWNQGLHYEGAWKDYWRVSVYGVGEWLRQTGWTVCDSGWFGEPGYASVYAVAVKNVVSRWMPPA